MRTYAVSPTRSRRRQDAPPGHFWPGAGPSAVSRPSGAANPAAWRRLPPCGGPRPLGRFTHTRRTEDKRSSRHVPRPSSCIARSDNSTSVCRLNSRIARADNSTHVCRHTLGSRGKSSWIGVYRPTYICNLCSQLSPSRPTLAPIADISLRRTKRRSGPGGDIRC